MIQAHILGPWATNCYIVRVPGQSRCWIVDAGVDPEVLIQAVRDQGLIPERLILTHAHIDHIAGVDQVMLAFADPRPPILMIHADEAEFLNDPQLNLSAFLELPTTAPPADELLHDGDELELTGTRWRVAHTPGHSPGGICLLNMESKQAIVGDTLFAGSIGRSDFPTSDGPMLLKSIRTKLLSLPDDFVIYPGHGPQSTIGEERRSNPFVGQRR